MSVKDKTYLLVTVVFLLVSGYFAFSNVFVRYSHYKQNLRQDTYFLENYHRQLTSRFTKTLKAGLSRISADSDIIAAVKNKKPAALAYSIEKHISALGYEYPSDFFIVNFVDEEGELVYFSDAESRSCGAEASLNALSSKLNQSLSKVCNDKVLQFAAVPLFADGKLIGAAELGISMDFYANNVEQTIGYSMALLVKKNKLKNENITKPTYGDYVMMHNNNQSLFKRLFSESASPDTSATKIDTDGLSYRVIDHIRFFDSSGSDAGRFVYAKDITDEVSWMRSFIIRTILMTILFCTVSLYVIRTGFQKTIGGLEEKYTSSTQSLKNSETRYKSYADSSPIAIFTVDSAKNVTDMNSYACRLLGYTAEEIKGKSLYQVFHTLPAPVINNLVKRASLSNTAETTLTFNNSAGEHLYMLVKAVKLDGGSLLFNCLDITSTITADRKLQELNIELEQMNRTLELRVKEEVEKNRKQTHVMSEQKKLADMGMMVSAIAHQWRQPLNALGLLVQTLPDYLNLSDENPEIEKFEATAMSLIKRMSDTIDNFRLFFDTGREKTAFNTVDELRHSVDILSAKLSSGGIKVRYCCRRDNEEVYHDEPVCGRCGENIVHGNAGEFRQVVVNILYNSIDAILDKMRNDDLHTGHINIIIVCGDGRVSVTFEDNGTGADEIVLDRIFEPYYSTKDDSKSSGIGLYTVKILTEQNMKGHVRAFNNDLGGLSISLEFPTIKKA